MTDNVIKIDFDLARQLHELADRIGPILAKWKALFELLDFDNPDLVILDAQLELSELMLSVRIVDSPEAIAARKNILRDTIELRRIIRERVRPLGPPWERR